MSSGTQTVTVRLYPIGNLMEKTYGEGKRVDTLLKKTQMDITVVHYADSKKGLRLEDEEVVINKTIPTAQVRVHIPLAVAHRANSKSCVLFICRLHLHSKGYYPTNFDSDERWLGAVIGVEQTTATSIITIDATFKEKTRIAPKQELLNYFAWRENN